MTGVFFSQGEVYCSEPGSRYESFHRTMMKVRKSSAESRKASTENNNQGYVNYAVEDHHTEMVEQPSMSETERNLRLRMAKRDAMMR